MCVDWALLHTTQLSASLAALPPRLLTEDNRSMHVDWVFYTPHNFSASLAAFPPKLTSQTTAGAWHGRLWKIVHTQFPPPRLS